MNTVQLMNKTWNNFVDSPSDKIQYTLNEFIDKMEDSEYLRMSIKRIEYQNRMCTCQHFRESLQRKGFANFFLVKLESGYYFIYKPTLHYIDEENCEFLPAISEYKMESIKIDSKEYLKNFAIPLKETDYIYCLREKHLMTYEEFIS